MDKLPGASRISRTLSSEKANISIVVALSMVTIVFFVALAFDLGFLVMEKDSLRNKTEAAAKSGVQVLHKDSTYMQAFWASYDSYQRNDEILPPIYLYQRFHPGYYDYKKLYSDFPHFKNFASVRYGEVPADEPCNAVAILDMPKAVQTIEIKPSGASTGRVQSAGMAYAKNYTFLALSDASDAMRWYGWEDGYSNYKNCLIGSNGGIEFYGTETFDNKTVVEAGGAVVNDNGNVQINSIDKIRLPDINWDALREQAVSNGMVYDPETWSDSWTEDAFGNQLRRLVSGSAPNQTIHYFFIPQGEDEDGVLGTEGDHDGRTYFFEIPDPLPTGVSEIYLNMMNTDHAPANRIFWNCTIAARCNISTYPNPSYGPYLSTKYGNYEAYGEDGLVYIYGKRFYRWYTRYSHLPVSLPYGTVIRVEEDFTMYSQYLLSFFGVPENYYLKVIADTMYLYSPTWRKNAIEFHGNFGAPDLFRIGSLE